MAKKAKKISVIEDIFKLCKERNNFVLHNDEIRELSRTHDLKNLFDATKIDASKKLPPLLKEEDYFIIHLGKGNHQFFRGINKGYHQFEDIPENKIEDWDYKKSILNEFDTSESNILSVGTNQLIIHKFLYNDITANPKIYFARRTKKSLRYKIDNEPIETDSVQMEIDLTMEYQGQVTVFECKNGFPKDFAVYQIFHPFLYFNEIKKTREVPIKEINCCYLLRKKHKGESWIRIFKYTFDDPEQMTSIRLIKCAQYNLIRR